MNTCAPQRPAVHTVPALKPRAFAQASQSLPQLPQFLVSVWSADHVLPHSVWLLRQLATPPAVIARLHQATVAAMRDPGVQEKLSSQGLSLVGGSPDEFTAYIRSEIEKWGRKGKVHATVPDFQRGVPYPVIPG